MEAQSREAICSGSQRLRSGKPEIGKLREASGLGCWQKQAAMISRASVGLSAFSHDGRLNRSHSDFMAKQILVF